MWSPLAWSLDHVGPLARTVWDAAAVFQAIAGPDARDEQCSRTPAPDFCRELDRGIAKFPIGVPSNYFLDHLDLDVEQALKSAGKKLEELGARVEAVRLPAFDHATALTLVIQLAEATAFHQKHLRERRNDIGEDVRALLEQGECILATDYLNAQRARRRFIAEMQAVFRKVAVLIAPTTPVTAAGIGETTVRVNSDVENVRMASTRLVRAFNFAGLPVLSVPCGFDRHGLPIGMQIIGKPFDEATVLRVGHAYESACEWRHRRPPEAP